MQQSDVPYKKYAVHNMLFAGVIAEPRHIVAFILGQIFLAPALGFVMAKVTLYWLRHLYTDVVHEVSVSFSMAYLTLYIGKVRLFSILLNVVYYKTAQSHFSL